MGVGTRRARRVVGWRFEEQLGTQRIVNFGDGIGAREAETVAIFVNTPLEIGIVKYQVAWAGLDEEGRIIEITREYAQSGNYVVAWDEFDEEE